MATAYLAIAIEPQRRGWTGRNLAVPFWHCFHVVEESWRTKATLPLSTYLADVICHGQWRRDLWCDRLGFLPCLRTRTLFQPPQKNSLQPSVLSRPQPDSSPIHPAIHEVFIDSIALMPPKRPEIPEAVLPRPPAMAGSSLEGILSVQPEPDNQGTLNGDFLESPDLGTTR
jgi:hypothetical protein